MKLVAWFMLSFLLLASAPWGHFFSVLALPMQMTVNQRSAECLYDQLDKGETFTASVFILSGPQLRATLSIDGPISETDVENGIELQQKVDQWPGLKKDPSEEKYLTYSQEVNFEDLKPNFEDDDEAGNDDREEEESLDENDPDYAAKRKERRERQRAKFIAAKEKREKQRAMEQEAVRQDGEPQQITMKAPTAGWYRVCVQGTWYQVLAELEFRKESDLGGIGSDGHVKTYEQQMIDQEDQDLEKDTASEEGIKDEDFQETRDKIKDLRRLLNEIQTLQQKERRRLNVHTETNEHSHSRMVLSSLLETLLFMAITGFQVYTIRKWFSGAPVLAF